MMLSPLLLMFLSLLGTATSPSNASIIIVSDLDDVLRITELWNPIRAIQRIFFDDFEPVKGMPALYHDFAEASGTEFAYITDGFVSWSFSYMHGLQQYYPDGNAYFRLLSFSNPKMIFSARLLHAQHLINDHPDSKFILVGDFATPGLVNAYAKLTLKNPLQVQCLLFLDLRATNPANFFIPATKPLTHPALANRWTVFSTPEEFHDDAIAHLHHLRLTTNSSLGCGSLRPRQHTFLRLVENKHYGGLKAGGMTLLQGFAEMLKCLMLLPHRPSPSCRFDRREGTWYPFYHKFESRGELRDWKDIEVRMIDGERYTRVCHEGGRFYLVQSHCEEGLGGKWEQG